MSTWAWTSASIPSRGAIADQQARRTATFAEMEVVADRNAADAEALDQVMVNEILRAGQRGLVGVITTAPASRCPPATWLVGLVGGGIGGCSG
jgi:hypothetical protein